jgi:hypothetical protein
MSNINTTLKIAAKTARFIGLGLEITDALLKVRDERQTRAKFKNLPSYVRVMHQQGSKAEAYGTKGRTRRPR